MEQAAFFGSKQPFEEYYVSFNFAQYLGAATISVAVVGAVDLDTGADVTATVTNVGVQVISGTLVYVWVRAGTTGRNYKISCRVTASDGSKYELDGTLPVVEQ